MDNFCGKCGALLEKDYKFCPKCGADIIESSIKRNTNARPHSNGDDYRVLTWIAVVILVISLLCVGGGCYYYFQHEKQIMVEREHGLDEKEIETEDKNNDDIKGIVNEKSPDVYDRNAKDVDVKKEKVSSYAKLALTALSFNEMNLKNIAADINSGKYDTKLLLSFIKNNQDAMKMQILIAKESENRVREIDVILDELYELQKKRLECMKRGVQGDKLQFAVGKKYYEEYQDKIKQLESKQ